MGENNDEDAEKFAILYFMHLFVLSNIDTIVIPRLHFDLVASSRYKDFPWGSLSFEDLARSLNNQLKAGGKFYLIQGMPLAIQVWLYECCSNVPPKIALKASSSKTKKGKQTTRVIFPQVQSKPDSHVEEVAMSKRESHVEKETFISKKVFDAFLEEVREEFTGVHEEFTRIRQLVKKKFKKMVKAIEHSKITDEKLDDTNLSDSQFTIPDELLPSLNAYRRESITRHPLATCEEEQTDEHFNEKKSKSAVQDRCQHIDVCFYYLRKKSKYDPNRSYKFSTVNCNFMNIISSVHDVYSADAANLTAGGQVAHLNEYINGFRMHAVVPWHTVDIYIPVNIMEKHHWVLAILSFSERCIFLYDSYESSGHYSIVLDVIEKLATIISLYLQHCNFYAKKGIDVENHPRYKDKDSSDMFDVLFQESLPQEPSGSLDCGVYMVTYAECLSYGHKVLANEFDPNALRTRYVALLWEYGTRKQDANAHSDVEAPLRPAGKVE
ncbi:hypothetical protein T459_27987 [Capsicum annuum]|uniref:Ubiquitin-like protease family profile domain-containing protein n=1 Tax=Capsicum annuum TaxID=4072 RepID=A0A2G2YFJ9_CAPAN|nr:hypothetical protein T459_27987 [Capsicum annuum]